MWTMSENHPLKVWRDGKQLSQEEAGVLVGVDAMTFSRWERGVHLPRKSLWSAIAKETGISPADLVGHMQTEAAQ